MFESEVEARENQFVAEADLVVAVLGERENFLLIDLSGGQTDRATFDAAMAEGKARGFFLCGFLRRAKDGTPGVLCVDPRGVTTMSLAAMSWVLSNAEHFRSAPIQTGDWFAWASCLYAAPDTRTDYGPN